VPKPRGTPLGHRQGDMLCGMSQTAESRPMSVTPVSAQPYGVELSCQSNVAQLRLSGECDVAAVSAIVSTCSHALADGADVIAVDLSDVTFIDCAALGAVIECHHRAVAAGALLRIVGTSPAVDRLRRLAGYPFQLLQIITA
jgi:anti-anti-sigma factor